MNSDAVVIIDGLTKVRFVSNFLQRYLITYISGIARRTGVSQVGVSAGLSDPRTSSLRSRNRVRSLTVVQIIRGCFPSLHPPCRSLNPHTVCSSQLFRFLSRSVSRKRRCVDHNVAQRKGEADADGPQIALQRHFKAKRDHVLKRLHALHLDVDVPPQATFYIWLNLEKLPPPLNNGLVRWLVLKEKIVC